MRPIGIPSELGTAAKTLIDSGATFKEVARTLNMTRANVYFLIVRVTKANLAMESAKHHAGAFLGARAVNTLRKISIDIYELDALERTGALSCAELLRIPNCGARVIEQVNNWLANNSLEPLALKSVIEPPPP